MSCRQRVASIIFLNFFLYKKKSKNFKIYRLSVCLSTYLVRPVVVLWSISTLKCCRQHGEIGSCLADSMGKLVVVLQTVWLNSQLSDRQYGRISNFHNRQLVLALLTVWHTRFAIANIFTVDSMVKLIKVLQTVW
jgi:hypothetical protein